MPEYSNEYLSRYLPFLREFLHKINNSKFIKDNYEVDQVSLANIEHFLSRPNYSYRYFSISKKKSGLRTIYEPVASLKAIQQYILEYYFNKNLIDFKFSKSVIGYLPNKSVKDNAEPHLNKKYLIQVDIKDFFPSITQTMVMTKIREKLSLSYEEAYMISKLTTRKGSLPQGAPTSPFLANICAISLDNRVHGFIQWLKVKLPHVNIAYTRYADDLTFSCSSKINFSRFITSIYNIIYDEGYIPNIEKTRVVPSKSQQKVTGIIVNTIMSIDKKERQELKFLLKVWLCYGFENIQDVILRILKKEDLKEDKLLEILGGKIAFIKYVNPTQADKLSKLYEKVKLEYEKKI